MVVVDLIDIERRYSSLEHIWKEGSLKLHLFEDAQRSAVFTDLVTLQRLVRAESEVFQPFQELLSYIHWDLRGYVAIHSVSSIFWQARASELAERAASIAHAMNENQKVATQSLRSKIVELSSTDGQYLESLKAMASDDEVLLVVEKPRQRWLLQALIDEVDEWSNASVVSLSTLFRSADLASKSVYILAAPSRVPDKHMRALLLGGAIGDATFICPNWLAGVQPGLLKHDLVPGLTIGSNLELAVSGQIFDDNKFEFDDSDFVGQMGHGQTEIFDPYIGLGPIECRLISLAGGFVMPVELTSSRVSVLEIDEALSVSVQYREPGKSLLAGDILFELKDGAEEDFLMELAQVKMGADFHEFAEGRARWKALAQEMIDALGFEKAVSALKKSGVSTAHYLQDWLDDADFTTPRAKKDWLNLLVALGFEAAAAERLAALGSQLRGDLISIGQNARRQMADAVTADDFEKIEMGQPVTKQLDDFGDAVFVLARVVAIDSGTKFCMPSEIRKVLRKK